MNLTLSQLAALSYIENYFGTIPKLRQLELEGLLAMSSIVRLRP